MAPSFINSLNFQWSNFPLFLFFLFSPENSGREKVHQGQARLACGSASLLKERENGRERDEKMLHPCCSPGFFLLAWWRHLLLITSSSNQGQQDLLVALFLQLGKSGRERDEKMLHPCCSPGFLAWWRHLLSMASNSIKASNNFQIF